MKYEINLHVHTSHAKWAHSQENFGGFFSAVVVHMVYDLWSFSVTLHYSTYRTSITTHISVCPEGVLDPHLALNICDGSLETHVKTR